MPVKAFQLSSAWRKKGISDQSTRIRGEQIRLIYRQGPVMVLGATLIGVILTGYLWQELAHRELGYWLLMIFLSAVLRTVVFRSFQSSPQANEEEVETDHSRWGLLFWVTSMFAGSIWGLLPLLFSSELTAENLLLISTIFAGMVAVTASAGTVYPPTYYSFALPLVVPLIFIELLSNNKVLVVTGTMLILYMLVTILLVRRGHQQFVELVEARYENANLMNRLNEEKEIAEAAVEIKNRFMAAASHDLRQPLHALGMFIGSLRKRDTDPERLEIIGDIESSTTSLNQLLHGLLDLSRLEAGVVIPEMRSVRLFDITSKLRGEYAVQAKHKNLTFHVQKTDVVLTTDPLLLERVLRNLLSNAIAYTPKGYVKLTCEVGDCESVDILVIDSGPGISEASRDLVFEEYYRFSPGDPLVSTNTESANSVATGMGLGLSIVRRLCGLLGIAISIESKVGSTGTIFRLRMPKAVDSASASSATSPEKISGRVQQVAGSCVLIIDDDVQVRKSVSRWLSDQDLIVVEASSARSALLTLAQESLLPDLILCDFRLGDDENGLDTVAALRESGLGAIPAIIISGDTSPEVLRQVKATGLTLLHKPISEPALYESIVAELDSRCDSPVHC